MNSTIRYIAKIRHSQTFTPEVIRAEEWAIIRQSVMPAVLSKTKGRCFYCGEALGKNWHVDHFHPLSKGGDDAVENLFPACSKCNGSKGAFTLEEWRMSRRVKIGRDCYGVPQLSRQAIEWLFTKGVDVLEGIPDYEFWFEAEGYPTPLGSTGSNEAPDWVKRDALKRLEAYHKSNVLYHMQQEAHRQGVPIEVIEAQVLAAEDSAPTRKPRPNREGVSA